MDEDADAITNLWLEEWHGPLAEPLPKEQNQEDQPANQGGNPGTSGDAGIGQGSNGGDGQDKDDNSGDGGSHRSDEEKTPTDEETRN